MLPEQDSFIESLHRKYYKQLVIYTVSALRDPDRAQDVVQDTFHEALMQISDLLAHENPGGWLMNTLKNKIRENERAHRRYVRRFISLDFEVSEELSPPSELITELSEPEDVSPIEKVERALTPKEYQLWKRLMLDRASHLDVARELDITVYASQKRLQRIMDKLREVFPERKKMKKK